MRKSNFTPVNKKAEPCVMCATDLSPAAQCATAMAAELAEAFDAKLLVVHAMEIWDKRYDFLVSDLVDNLARQAREKVSLELEHLGKTEAVPVEVLIRQGPIIEQLINVVMERKPLMLVVGCNGSPNPDELHLGGMAQELIRLSPVSVIVTRPSTSPDIKHILCAVGGGPDSKATLDWAIGLAKRERVNEITLVHAFQVPTGYLEAGMTYEDARARMLKLHQSDIAKLLTPHAKSPIKIKTVIEDGPIHETVARIASKQKTDILVVGSESRSFMAALLLGRMGLRIASQTRVPVALIKSKAHQLGLLSALERL